MAKYTSKFTGVEIDTLLGDVSGKFGHIEITEFNEENSTYIMHCYASRDDFETGKEPLQKVEIPISTAKGRSYASSFKTQSKYEKANIVVSEQTLTVPINYRSLVNDPIEGITNAGIKGTLIIQRGTDTSSYETVDTLVDYLESQLEATNYIDFDVTPYLAQGKQYIRLQASFDYETDGEKKTARSTFINVGSSIVKTSLRIELETEYNVPMQAKDSITGADKPFMVDYRVYGACAKVLVAKITGAIGTETISIPLKTTDDGVTTEIMRDENSAYGFLTHGIKKVEVHLQAEDGLGGTIKSDVLTNSFMMVNPSSPTYDATKKFLLVQNLKSEVTNYIQSTLLDYAVYVEDGSITEVEFRLTDSDDVPYTSIKRTVEANKPNSLVTTIEIEADESTAIPNGYDTRFYVYRDGKNNFITENSLNERTPYFDIRVDNTQAVTPLQGATFLLNPKNRSNDEADRGVIYNAVNGMAVDAELTNFGFMHDMWVTDDDGYKCLRILAGQELKIKKNIWAQFMSNPNSSLTIDIDFKVRNVTNLADPIINISGGDAKGLILNSLNGWIRTASYNDDDNCMFAWREDKRQYLSLNISHLVYPKKANVKDVIYPSDSETKSNGSLALARVLLNGDPVREIPFSTTSATEWCSDSNAAIVIGNEGTDIDIYSIRIYENKRIDWVDLLNRNYLSSIPSTEEKMRIKRRNALMAGGRITLQAAQELGINCIVYHADRPYISDKADKTGWVEYFRYDQDGKKLNEYSGTNCKNSKLLPMKGQGSTAKTYYEWNIQDDNSKVKDANDKTPKIQVALDDFHESIHVRVEGDKAYIYGGNLGDKYPLEQIEKEYDYADGMVSVPDGWIDGNGKYRGVGYMVAEGTSLAQKKVAKINYASAMQSHLLGACKSYDDLHFAVVGASPMQQQYIDRGFIRPVFAKHTEPFLMFWEVDGEAVYTGLCVYGAGKADKVSWGYVKKDHPMFSMIEGSDNNLPLTDFRVPFDESVTYNVKEEYFEYNGEGSFDFDEGATNDDGTPKDAIRKQWSQFHNFIYLNSPNIKFYNGTAAQLRADSTVDSNSKYFCLSGEEAYHLLRAKYSKQEVDGKSVIVITWVDAGLGETIVDLRTDVRTKAKYDWYMENNRTGYADMTAAFNTALGEFVKAHGELFMSMKSLLFCYNYVLSFLAGTDNSSKNTYYVTDPIAQDMTAKYDAIFATWFSTQFGYDFNFGEVYQIFFHGDDMDSILPVNNKGNLTKPYYLERLYPYADGNTTDCLYEGIHNQLFNLVEVMYSAKERSANMNEILSAMGGLVSKDDNLLGLTDNKQSVWGFLHKYFFNVQYYFPQIAYIEQARIRYEFAELMGHTGARGVRPISQSIGSQVENEQQFMDQRVIYMASFAVFGALGDGAGEIGITDTKDNLAFQASPLPDGSPATISFTLTPHQYIYPCGYNGQTIVSSYLRTSPKQTCVLTIASNVDKVSDTTMGIRGVNYYSDLGDLSGLSVTTSISITGKRLKSLTSSESSVQAFRPSSVVVHTPNVSLLTLHAPAEILDMSNLSRLEVVELGSIRKPKFPISNVLTGVSIKGEVKEVVLEGLPSLTALNIENKSAIVKIVLDAPKLHTQQLIEGIYNAQKKSSALQYISVRDVDWKGLSVETLQWLMLRETCEFWGKIGIYEPSTLINAITFDIKNDINKKFGNVDDVTSPNHRGLLLDYKRKTLNLANATITGSFFADDLKVQAGECAEVENFPFIFTPDSRYSNTHTGLSWSVEGGGPYTMDGDGMLSVRMYELSSNKHVATIKALVSTHEDGKASSGAVTKEVPVWLRPAQVGDHVYYDGSYGPASEDNDEKTVIGVCCYVAPRKADGSINETFHDPQDKHVRLMMALDDVTASSDTETFSSWQWGAYYSGADNNSLYSTEADGTKKQLSLDGGTTTIYDVPNLRNITSSGLTNTDGAESNYISDDNLRDTVSDLGLENDGFKPYPADKAIGDGFAYGETEVYKNERKIDDTLLPLAGDGYKKGDMVNSGYIKTLRVIYHRNTLIDHCYEKALPINNMNIPLYPVTGDDELSVLAQRMSDIRAWAKGTGTGQLGDTANGNRWSQLYYPAASACFAYEPKGLKDGEQLPARFSKHNWFLATNGLLARIWWYFYKYENSKIIVRDDTPFIAAISKGKLKRPPSSSYFWSVTEYYSNSSWYVNFTNGGTNFNNKSNSYRGRAVSAF